MPTMEDLKEFNDFMDYYRLAKEAYLLALNRVQLELVSHEKKKIPSGHFISDDGKVCYTYECINGLVEALKLEGL